MELNDVTSYLGLKATTIEDFKKEFGAKYKTDQQFLEDSELLSKATGRVTSQITDNLIKVARAQGVEFTRKEIEELKIEDIFNTMLEKQATSYTEKITELEAGQGKNNDEKLKEWEEKYKKLEGKLGDTQGLLKSQTSEFEKFKSDTEIRVKGVKLDYVKEKLWSGVKYAPGTTDLQIRGFKSKIDEKYKFDLDENGLEFAADTQGKRIPNPQKHGEFYTPSEVIALELAAEKLDVKNQDAGKVWQGQGFGQGQGQGNKVEVKIEGNKSGPRINPRFADMK